MAQRNAILDENVPGEYYVGTACAGCGLCLETAPRNFLANAHEGHSFVSRQPANELEKAQCREAKAWCPVEAIGDDRLEFGTAACPEEESRLAIVH